MSASATVVLDSLAAQSSAGAIKSKANFIEAHTRGMDDAQAHQQSARALSNLQDQINALNKALRSLAIAITATSAPTPLGNDGVTLDSLPVIY